MLKMVDGTGIIGVDMVCPLGGTVSPPQPPNYDKVEVEGVGSLMLPNSLEAPVERVELIGNSVQGENPAPDNPQEIKSAGRFDEASGKYLFDVKVTGKNLLNLQKEPDVKGTYQGWKVGDGKKTIILSIKDKGNNVDITKCSIGVSGNGINPNDGLGWIVQDGTILRSEIKTTNPYVTIYPPNETAVQKFLDRFEIQVEYGTTATPFEPYTEQTLTLTSDRPITKWDKLVEQGGEYGWLYGSKIYVVTGNEVFESRDGYNIESYTNRFFILNDLLKKNDALKPLAYMKCLRNVQYVYSPNIFEEGFETNINQFHIKLSNDRVGILASDDHAVRTAKFSGYMKKIHKNGNPIEILYATTDTVFFPLSQEEQTQLRNLHSYIGTTNIMVDSGEIPCGIKLTYRKEI